MIHMTLTISTNHNRKLRRYPSHLIFHLTIGLTALVLGVLDYPLALTSHMPVLQYSTVTVTLVRDIIQVITVIHTVSPTMPPHLMSGFHQKNLSSTNQATS